MILKSEIFHQLDLTRQASFIITIYDEDGLKLAGTNAHSNPTGAFVEARKIVDNKIESLRKNNLPGRATSTLLQGQLFFGSYGSTASMTYNERESHTAALERVPLDGRRAEVRVAWPWPKLHSPIGAQAARAGIHPKQNVQVAKL